MHDIVIVGIPLLAILAGIFFNRNDVRDLRADMLTGFKRVDERFNQVDQRFNQVDQRVKSLEDDIRAINVDLRQFYHLTGKLDARMDAVEKRH